MLPWSKVEQLGRTTTGALADLELVMRQPNVNSEALSRVAVRAEREQGGSLEPQ